MAEKTTSVKRRSQMKAELSSQPSDNTAQNKRIEKNNKTLKSGKQSRLSRCCHAIKDLLKWVFIVVIIPPIINYGSLKKENESLLPADAIMYDVGRGQQVMLRCRGKGAPTILLESPTGMSSDIWYDVSTALSEVTKVCRYDRAGIGFSDRPVKVQQTLAQESAEKSTRHQSEHFTVEKMVDDLKRLITEVSSHPQPFILVGSELGALVSRFYSHLYDDHVLEVVLIDPLTPPLFNNQMWMDFWNSRIASLQLQQFLGAIGATRLGLITGLSTLPDLWSEVNEENCTSRQLHLSCHPKHLLSAADEHIGSISSLQQIKMISTVKPFPKSLNYTILYRRRFDNSISENLNDLWWNSRHEISSSLQIPPSQVTVKETSAANTSSSMTGLRAKYIVSILKQKIYNYRKGKKVQSS